MIPKITEEKKLWKRGYRYIACVDEAGRGPLAGPVVAAAVCLDFKLGLKLGRDKFSLSRPSFTRLRDSKKLSPKRREEIYEKIKQHPAIQWGIGIVSEKVIDKINIFQATRLAMERAFKNLMKKLPAQKPNNCNEIVPVILDGNMRLNIKTLQIAIVKGDEKVFSCALASILAKVTRDKMMLEYHKKYPQYGFDRHKGYGTPEHIRALRHHGPCFIHRKTFNPVANTLNVKAQISNAKTI